MEFDLSKPYCYYFNEMAKIPHGSFNELAISNWLVDFAKEHNLKYVQDEALNVVIYKEASKGYENAKPLLLQAHVDMVCEANKSTQFDFEKDSLQLYVEDEWLMAKGTTLGADDGTGVCYMLAILADDSLPHPALECCFTTQEEVGLIGALQLDPSLFKARRMVSLDGGGEVTTAISSAGGCIVEGSIETEMVANEDPTYKLFITGLAGGHSGGEIHKEKGNSNKLALRIVKEMELAGAKVNLVSANGGLKDNAIPREAEVIFTSCADKALLQASFEKSVKNICTELEFSDAGFSATLENCDKVELHMSDATSANVLNFLYLLPNGFRHRSMAIEGLTITSLNLGILRTVEGKVVATTAVRSALESGVDHLIDIITVLGSSFGAKVSVSARYPGWNYKAVSPMRDLLNEVLMETNGQPLVTIATHGGCECGVFAAMSEEMDILTYGPVTQSIHTPGERLNLASFDRGYKILCSLVSKCN